jgi:hypothetical protein
MSPPRASTRCRWPGPSDQPSWLTLAAAPGAAALRLGVHSRVSTSLDTNGDRTKGLASDITVPLSVRIERRAQPEVEIPRSTRVSRLRSNTNGGRTRGLASDNRPPLRSYRAEGAARSRDTPRAALACLDLARHERRSDQGPRVRHNRPPLRSYRAEGAARSRDTPRDARVSRLRSTRTESGFPPQPGAKPLRSCLGCTALMPI